MTGCPSLSALSINQMVVDGEAQPITMKNIKRQENNEHRTQVSMLLLSEITHLLSIILFIGFLL